MTNLPGCDIAKHKNDAKWKICFVSFVTPVTMCTGCHSKPADTSDYKSWNCRKEKMHKIKVRVTNLRAVFSLFLNLMKPVLVREVLLNLRIEKKSFFDSVCKIIARRMWDILNRLIFWFSFAGFLGRQPHQLRFVWLWCNRRRHVMLASSCNLKIVICIKTLIYLDGFVMSI